MAKTAPPAAELAGRRGRLQGQGSTAAGPAPPHPTLASIGRSRTFTIEKEEEEEKDADEKKNQKVSFDPTLSVTGPGYSLSTPAAMPTPAPRERRQRPPAGDGDYATPERAVALGLGALAGEATTAPVPAPRRVPRTRVGEPASSTVPSEEARRPAEADGGRGGGGRRRLLRRQAAGESSSSDAESARGRGGQKIVLVTEAEVHEPPSAARSEVVRKARPEQGASRRGSAIPESLLDEIKRMSQTSQASQDSARGSVEEGAGDTLRELAAGAGGDGDVAEAPDEGGADALLEAYEEPVVVPTAASDGEVNTTTTSTTPSSHSAEGTVIVPMEQTDAPSPHDGGVHVEQAASALTPPKTDSDDVSPPSVTIPEAPIQDLPGADLVEIHPPVAASEEQPPVVVQISDEHPSSVDVPEEQRSPKQKTVPDEQPPIEAVLEDHPPALLTATDKRLSPTTTAPEEQPPIVTTAEEHPLPVTAPDEVVTPAERLATSSTQGESRAAPPPALPTSPPSEGQGLHDAGETELPEPESHVGAAETTPGRRPGRGGEAEGVEGATTARTLHRMDDSTRERLQRHIERAVLGAAGGPPVSREALQAGLDQASAALAAFYATPSSEAEAVRLRSEELLSRLRRLREEVSASVVFPVRAACRVSQSAPPSRPRDPAAPAAARRRRHGPGAVLSRSSSRPPEPELQPPTGAGAGAGANRIWLKAESRTTRLTSHHTPAPARPSATRQSATSAP